jgi:hypothetical protein
MNADFTPSHNVEILAGIAFPENDVTPLIIDEPHFSEPTSGLLRVEIAHDLETPDHSLQRAVGNVGIDPAVLAFFALDYGGEIFTRDLQRCGSGGSASLGFAPGTFDEDFISERFIGMQSAEEDIASGIVGGEQMNGPGKDDVKGVTLIALTVEAFTAPKAFQPHAIGEQLKLLGIGQNPEEFDPPERPDDIFPR